MSRLIKIVGKIEQTKLTTLVVAISMLMAPLLLMFYEKIISAGYGRFGQVIGRLLTAQGYHLSIPDHRLS